MFRIFPRKEPVGERALREVSEMLMHGFETRERLRSAGWKIDSRIPLVNNERVWRHPSGCGAMTEEKAFQFMKAEEKAGLNG